jgi:hypothetical protein
VKCRVLRVIAEYDSAIKTAMSWLLWGGLFVAAVAMHLNAW